MAQSSVHVQLIVGEDDYLVDRKARSFLEAVVPENLRATAVETIEGAADNQEAQVNLIAACRASVETPPFLDPVKFTWWRRVTFLPGGPAKNIADRTKAAVEKFARDLAARPLPENQYFVVTAPRILAASIVAKTFKTFAEVTVFETPKWSKDRAAMALARLPELAEEEGLAFAPDAAASFVAKIGADTRTMISELRKMRTYLGEEKRDVTLGDVASVTSVGGEEPELWLLTDAVARRDIAKVEELVGTYLGQNGAGIMLSTVLEKYFRELALYRDAVDRNLITLHGFARHLPAEAVALLDGAGIGPNTEKNTRTLFKKAQAARNFTPRELRVARHRMMKVREKLVTSQAEDTLVATELLRIVPRARRP